MNFYPSNINQIAQDFGFRIEDQENKFNLKVVPNSDLLNKKIGNNYFLIWKSGQLYGIKQFNSENTFSTLIDLPKNIILAIKEQDYHTVFSFLSNLTSLDPKIKNNLFLDNELDFFFQKTFNDYNLNHILKDTINIKFNFFDNIEIGYYKKNYIFNKIDFDLNNFKELYFIDFQKFDINQEITYNLKKNSIPTNKLYNQLINSIDLRRNFIKKLILSLQKLSIKDPPFYYKEINSQNIIIDQNFEPIILNYSIYETPYKNYEIINLIQYLEYFYFYQKDISTEIHEEFLNLKEKLKICNLLIDIDIENLF